MSSDIPEFLRLTAEQRAAAWAARPPAAAPPAVISVKRGRYPEHWLRDPGTRALIAEEEAKKLGQWTPGNRYSVFWRQSAGGELKFVGYHDRSRSDADWDDSINSYVVEGGPPPEVDWPADGADFSTMPAVRDVGSGRQMTRSARRAQRAAEKYEKSSRREPEKKERGTRRQSTSYYPPSTAVIRVVGEHGRKPGTPKHARAEAVVQHAGKFVATFLEAGGNPVTLKNAVKERWVELEETKS